MSRESELRDEFPILAYLLECWYYQGIWTEFKNDEEIWEKAFESAESHGLLAAFNESSTMLGRSETEIHEFIQLFSEANLNADVSYSKEWLYKLYHWLKSRCSGKVL
ncbi:hypothetical protein B3C1_18452 [Gallaecimonas xiamenensis 3-C-1]|uniref:CdiI immunity protein domain-containing protein n=1 Tax=Gallaecimonas xiamenensis 3-C-1 TaxID=745411 RepID=K2IC71_9GAMM|nr:hypothetical protein B3C1_18452 [Gallaecimonas xiamenensis 3-C-1]